VWDQQPQHGKIYCYGATDEAKTLKGYSASKEDIYKEMAYIFMKYVNYLKYADYIFAIPKH
jgi:hypothetical protein